MQWNRSYTNRNYYMSMQQSFCNLKGEASTPCFRAERRPLGTFPSSYVSSRKPRPTGPPFSPCPWGTLTGHCAALPSRSVPITPFPDRPGDRAGVWSGASCARRPPSPSSRPVAAGPGLPWCVGRGGRRVRTTDCPRGEGPRGRVRGLDRRLTTGGTSEDRGGVTRLDGTGTGQV